MSKVPNRDTVQAINDLAEGRVHAYVGAYAILRPQLQAGKAKLLRRPTPTRRRARRQPILILNEFARRQR